MQEVTFPRWQLTINFTFLTHKLALICNHVFDEIKLRELLWGRIVYLRDIWEEMPNCVISRRVKITQNAWKLLGLYDVKFFSSIYGQFLEFVMKNIAISLISIILDLKILQEFKQKMDRRAKIHNCLYFLFNSCCQSFMSSPNFDILLLHSKSIKPLLKLCKIPKLFGQDCRL